MKRADDNANTSLSTLSAPLSVVVLYPTDAPFHNFPLTNLTEHFSRRSFRRRPPLIRLVFWTCRLQLRLFADAGSNCVPWWLCCPFQVLSHNADCSCSQTLLCACLALSSGKSPTAKHNVTLGEMLLQPFSLRTSRSMRRVEKSPEWGALNPILLRLFHSPTGRCRRIRMARDQKYLNCSLPAKVR